MNTQNFEQLINLYHNLFVWCGIIAIVLLLVAIFLFIWLKIPRVYDELSGRGAKKAIAEMGETGASGALTGRGIDQSGKRKGRTGILQQQNPQRTAGSGALGYSGNMSGQMSGQISGPMSGQMSGQIASPVSAAMGPSAGGYAPEPEEVYAETAPLAAGMIPQAPTPTPTGFRVIRSIVEIHTDEVIPE